jgi:cell division protein ZipA
MQLLYALGVAVMLVLLFRAGQWFSDYRRSLRIKLERVPPGPESEGTTYPELGKVRVRPRFDHKDSEDDELHTPAAALRSSPIVVLEPEPDAGQDVPVLQAEPQPPAVPQQEPAPVIIAEPVPEPVVVEEENIPVLLTPVPAAAPVVEVEQHDMFANEPIAPPPSRRPEAAPSATTPGTTTPGTPSARASALYEKTVEPVRQVAAPLEEDKPHLDVQDFIALHVVAREYPFNGEDLLRSVLSYGLRFGEMSIFHRHEQPTGQGRILFSMAKAVEPGTFNLESMTGEEVPGVSFFLSLPGVNSIHAYDIMVDTVKRLAVELQGEILDEQQQVLTRQLIEHYRERVQEFERRRLMNRPSA